MHTPLFNSDRQPFEMAADQSFLWLSEKQDNDFRTLRYGILENQGFFLVTGVAGSGKTILSKALIESLEGGIFHAVVDDPRLERIDFYNTIARGFGIDNNFTSKVQFLIQFSHFLHKADDDNRKVLLLVDDCHLLSQEMLEELRLLSNIEKDDKKLINILFVGRPEFKELLLLTKNRALSQRLTQLVELLPFSPNDTADYIHHRLKVAGLDEKIFTAKAIQTIHRCAQGIPRRINGICKQALLGAAELQRKTIDNKLIEVTVQRMDLFATLPRESLEISMDEEVDFNPFRGKTLLGSGYEQPSFSGFNLEKDHQRRWIKYSVGLLGLCIVGIYIWSLAPHFLESSQTVVVENVTEPVAKVGSVVNSSPAVTLLEENMTAMSDKKAAELKTAILENAYGDDEQNRMTQDNLYGKTSIGQDEVVAEEIQPSAYTDTVKTESVREVEKDSVKNIVSENVLPPENESDKVVGMDIVESIEEQQARVKEQERVGPAEPLEPRKIVVRLLPDSLKLTKSGMKELDSFVAKLKRYPRATVFVKGFVSAKTNSPENIQLSKDRALIVQKLMLKKGIDAEQIEVVGMGNQEPIASNSTREGRSLNRRVEIIVVNDGI